MNIITVERLSKRYKDTQALDKISLKIPKNSFFGIIGSNGAGKTTLISILITLLRPDSGLIKIAGFDIRRDPNEIRKRIGIVFQESVIDQNLTALQNLQLHARLYKMNPDDKKILQMLELANLTDLKDRKVKGFSGGMKRKLEIVRGLLNDPQILFLDEPTLGLDPIARRAIWNYLESVNNTTIFMATNYMDEANLCNHIAIINKGKIEVSGRKEKLLSTLRQDRVIIHTTKPVVLPDFKVELGINKMTIYTKNSERVLPSILKQIDGVTGIDIKKPSLEELFLKYTGDYQ